MRKHSLHISVQKTRESTALSLSRYEDGYERFRNELITKHNAMNDGSMRRAIGCARRVPPNGHHIPVRANALVCTIPRRLGYMDFGVLW